MAVFLRGTEAADDAGRLPDLCCVKEVDVRTVGTAVRGMMFSFDSCLMLSQHWHTQDNTLFVSTARPQDKRSRG